MCLLELIVSVGDIVSILFPIEDQGMFYGFLYIYACVVLTWGLLKPMKSFCGIVLQ